MSENVKLSNSECTLLPFQEEVVSDKSLKYLSKKHNKLWPRLGIYNDIIYVDDNTACEIFRKYSHHAPLYVKTRLYIAHRGHTVLVYPSLPKES
jgi:hypothetical protein